MTVVCCWLMDKAGRRWLLMVSTLGMSASAFTMGVYFNIKEVGIFNHFLGAGAE
jgi:MFS family permease